MIDNQTDNLNLVFFSLHNPIYFQYNHNKNAQNGW